MTTYRFRVKHERDPRSLWRDVVVGADRTLDEFQTVLNRAVGLDQGHLWFFGTGQDYWDGDVRYEAPGETDGAPSRRNGVPRHGTPARRRSAGWPSNSRSSSSLSSEISVT